MAPLFPAAPTVADLSGADLPGPAMLPLGPPDKPEPAAPAPIPPDPLTPALPALVPALVPAAVLPAPCAKAFEVNEVTASVNAAASIAFDRLFFIVVDSLNLMTIVIFGLKIHCNDVAKYQSNGSFGIVDEVDDFERSGN